MRIAVCVKEVPTSVEEIELVDGEIDEEGLTYGINEWDEYALEAAVVAAEEYDGEVTVITIGDEDCEETIYRTLAKDADRAIRVDGEMEMEMEGCDTYAKAEVLAAAIEHMDEQPDLVLTGLQSDDTQNAKAGGLLAETLGLPFSNYVTGLDLNLEEGIATVRRELEGGLSERREIELPAVLGIQTGITDPRYASIRMIRQAKRKPVDVYSLADLGIDDPSSRSKTAIGERYAAPTDESATTFEGDPDATAEQLANKLTELGLADV